MPIGGSFFRRGKPSHGSAEFRQSAAWQRQMGIDAVQFKIAAAADRTRDGSNFFSRFFLRLWKIGKRTKILFENFFIMMSYSLSGFANESHTEYAGRAKWRNGRGILVKMAINITKIAKEKAETKIEEVPYNQWRKRMYKLSLLVTIAVICLAFQFGNRVLEVSSQSLVRDDQMTRQFTSLKKVVKVEGWELPLGKTSSPNINVQNIIVGGISITTEEKAIDENFDFKYEDYHMGNDGALYTHLVPCEPSGIWSLRLQNTDKIFGYGMVCSAFVFDKERNVKRKILTAYPLYFYDEDEDGLFETRYYSANPPSLPEWVKLAAKNKK